MNKIIKNNWFLILKIVIAIVVFIAAVIFLKEIIALIKEPTDIFVVEEGKISLDETHDAYIIRNETVLKGENFENGMEKIKAEGKKVAKGDSVFRYYANSEGDIRKRIEELTSQIEEAQKDEIPVFTNDVENLKNEIRVLIDGTYKLNNIEEIEKNKKQIEEYTNKISRIVGENSPEGSHLKELINERNNCISQLTADAEEIYSPTSGTVSYRVDEFEDVFKSDNFDYISKDFLNDLGLKTGELISSSEESGKVINEFNCYLAIIMNSDAAKNAKEGDKVKIDIGSDRTVSAKVKHIKDEDDDRIIIFEVDSLDEKLVNYRKISATVIWWEYSGLKIPNSAITYDGDLAYVQRNRAGYNADVLVKVVRSNGDYSLVENYSTQELKDLGFSADEIRNMYNIKEYDRIQLKKK
ncbi:MAG: hypothetical protein IKF52_04780 [Clostridia bacterium]|nr:hypothetical protein [Clostridia bacterium]